LDEFQNLQEITSITEREEGKAIEKEIQARRTRLTGEKLSKEEIKRRVTREVYESSKVNTFYLVISILLIWVE
jgi:hypothetical protein